MKKYWFGIDVGGTTVKLGLFGEGRKLLKKWEIVTRTEDHGSHVLPDIRQALVAEMNVRGIRPEQLLGAGIGLPGPVDPQGVVNGCVNLGWGVVDVQRELSALLFDIPVRAGNDANVASLGEAWFGAGAGYSSMVMITLGTGVGGGVVVDGKIIPGFHGAAGEIGHVQCYDGARVPCKCGQTNCMELAGSATGIVHNAIELMKETDWPSALRGRRKISAKSVLDLHGQGDRIADAVIEDMVDSLGRGMAMIGCVVDPEAFVMGGGVSKAGQWLMDALAERFRQYAFHACRGTQVVAATLGNDAGIYGAAAMIMER